MTRYVVIGASAVGATTAAQLHLAGREIVLLARLHGREAPANAAVSARIARAVADRIPPRTLIDDDLLTVVPAASVARH